MKEHEKEFQQKTVSVETVTHSYNVIRIFLQKEIDSIEHHMDQIEAIRDAQEGDLVEVYCVSNRGGYIDTIVPLCNALATTPAHTVCYVEGHCASAGTFPSMICDQVFVGAYSSFMLHCASGGTGYGTMVNSAESAKFFEKQYTSLLDDIYTGFVTPEEAKMLHDGREIYLDADSIQERIERRAEKLAEEEEASCEDFSQEEDLSFPEIVHPLEEVVPKKKPTPKKAAK